MIKVMFMDKVSIMLISSLWIVTEVYVAFFGAVAM